MSTRGPMQVSSNGLVFYYDTFNNKSYKGQPTTNYMPYPYAAYNGATLALGDYNYANNGVTYTLDTTVPTPFGDYNGVMKYYTGNSDYKYFSVKASSLTSGTYTFSYYARLAAGSSNLNNQQLWRDNVTDRSVTGDWNPTYTTEWKRYVTTGPVDTVGATGNSLNYFPIHSGTLTGGFTVYFWGFQLEKLSYATPFTAGTRSNTNGLVDLVGSNTINLTNAGFDSSANLTFDGSTKYIDCSGLTKAATCTFEAWAKTTTLANSPMLFNAGNNGAGPDLFFYSNQIHWNTWDGGSNPFGSTPSSVTNGKYHHYVVVNDAGSNAKLYYDGSLLGTATYRTAAATTRLIVGGEPAGYLWTGDIPLFSVYSRALTASEVLQNFNKTKSRYGY